MDELLKMAGWIEMPLYMGLVRTKITLY